VCSDPANFISQAQTSWDQGRYHRTSPYNNPTKLNCNTNPKPNSTVTNEN